jgi:hypothetical protein
MPRAAAASKSSPHDAARRIDDLLILAITFVPRERGEAQIRKWLPRGQVMAMREDRLVAMTADAVRLAADLLLSQPSGSGANAFDRLARSQTQASAAHVAAIAALRAARFRLLRLDGDPRERPQTLRDVISGQALRLGGTTLPPIPAGTVLFSRVALLEDGFCCLAGAITPLDTAAAAFARGHAAAGAVAVAGNARWAEAVYGHVVRYGTLEVPGLNRPGGGNRDDAAASDGGPLFGLVKAWETLGAAAPDAALLQRTRQLANLPTILDALIGAVLSRGAGETAMAGAIERLLLVLLDTVLRREHGGSGTLTLDRVASAVDEAVRSAGMPRETAKLFAALRLRLAGGTTTRRADDPALERLVQRIQGLRAKTVAQGCTEQEALAAAEKVAELLDRYGLSLGELDFRAQACEGIGIQTDRRRFAPIDQCVNPIAAFFDCRVWVERAKDAPLRYVFFGLRADVTAAQYAYELVERAFDTETDAFRAGDLYARMAGDRRSATNSFQIGLARGIADKLNRLRAAREAARHSASGRDLVPVKAAMVEEELAKLGLDFQTRGSASGSRRVLAEAYREGEAAGQRFEVTPGITAAA